MHGFIYPVETNGLMSIQNVLIVEDELLFREYLVGWMKKEGYPAVREAASLAEAERMSVEEAPDLVLLDMDLPDGEGLDYVERQIKRKTTTRILVLTAHVANYPVLRFKKSGVMGALDKGETDGEVLRSAVEAVSQWKGYYSESVEKSFQKMVREPGAFYKKLSPREEEMLKHFGCGYSNGEISVKLGISEATVQGHRRNVMSKTGVRSTPELIIWAMQNGFVLPKKLGRMEQRGSG